MEWKFIVALIFAVPIILFPVAFIWYINIGGIVNAFTMARQRKAARMEQRTVVLQDQQAHPPAEGTQPVQHMH